MKKQYAILGMFVLCATLAKAQQNVTGWVTDEQRAPIEYANVIALSVRDSSLITGVITDSCGAFRITLPNDTPAFLRVSSVGYNLQTYTLPLTADTLRLKGEAAALEGVTVTAQRPKMALRNDALVTTIVGSTLSNVGSGNDVLKRIPLLSGKEGSYSVVGKGAAVIYINNRKVTDATELERLSSADIKDVEVVTNPGARYDATVRAVIRIHTIRRVGDGFGFDVRSNTLYWKHWNSFTQLNTRYRHKGLEIAASVDYDVTNSYQNQETVQELQVDDLWTNKWTGKSDFKNKDASFNLSAAYDFNTNHSVGVRFDTSKHFDGDNDHTGFYATDVLKNNLAYDHINSEMYGFKYAIPTKNLSAYYVGQIKKLSIDFNTDYYFSEDITKQTTIEQSTNYENRTVTSEGKSRSNFFATKLVLTHPVLGGNLSVGNENTYTNKTQNYATLEGFVPNAASRIKEANYAFFATYSRMTPIGNIQAGLRYEHVNSDYYDHGTYSPDHSRRYNRLFPSFSFATQIKNVGLQLAYTAKTSRPSYAQLGTDVTYLNRFTRQSGNPMLKPANVYDLSLITTWKVFTLVTSYTETHNQIMYSSEQESEDKSISTLRYRNIDKLPKFSLALVASPKFGIWSPQLTLFCQKQWFDINRLGSKFSLNKPIWGFKFNNTLEFKHDWVAEAFMGFNSKGMAENGEVIRNVCEVNLSLQKTLLKNRLILTLGVEDLFNRATQQATLYTENYKVTQYQEYDTRCAYFKVVYKFNTTRSKYKGTGAGRDERNRL